MKSLVIKKHTYTKVILKGRAYYYSTQHEYHELDFYRGVPPSRLSICRLSATDPLPFDRDRYNDDGFTVVRSLS